MGGKCSFCERSANVRGDLSARAGRWVIVFLPLQHNALLTQNIYWQNLRSTDFASALLHIGAKECDVEKSLRAPNMLYHGRRAT